MSTSSNNDSDWLLSSEDEAPSTSRTGARTATTTLQRGTTGAGAGAARRVPTMGERDWTRIASKFEDEGYREGITTGKQATLQAGFDEGFNKLGSSLGRSVGNLRGEATALLALLTSTAAAASPDAPTLALGMGGVRRATASAAAAARKKAEVSASASTDTAEQSAKAKALLPIVRSLVSDLNRLRLADLAPPDYEALVHEAEHRAEDGGPVDAVPRESEEQKREREAVLPRLQERMKEVLEQARAIIG